MKKILLISVIFILGFNIVVSQTWKTYPYHKQGSLIYFPQDEGWHSSEPTEWWYTVAHITGDSTGNEYTYMLTYFYYPYYGFDGFRIFNLSNETNHVFYDETLPCDYPVLSQDSLNIQAQPYGSNQEIWTNLTDSSGKALAFQYHINATHEHGFIDVEYDAFKPPLLLADSGYLYEGAGDYTYYYSQTGINVTGTISIDSITESVSGIAWIDHQYGEFNPNSGEQYEWFSIQLSNGMDFNVWNIFNTNNQIPNTCTYRICCIYYNDTTDTTVSDFTIERLKYAYMPDMLRCYSQKWHLIWNDIDLIITTSNSENEVQMPFRFYEGSTEITGTVSGQNVTGLGFAELLHSYEKPQLQFTNPDTFSVWTSFLPVTWTILNPDQGNPLHYALSYSTDGGDSFNPIIDNITDTAYNWDFSGLADSIYCILKITGYSIDSIITGTSLSDTVLIINTGIEHYFKNESIYIYPNPTTGIFTIKGNNNLSGNRRIQSIEITNVYGQIIYVKNPQGFQNLADLVQIDLSEQPKGIYFIHIFDNNILIGSSKIIVI